MHVLPVLLVLVAVGLSQRRQKPLAPGAALCCEKAQNGGCHLLALLGKTCEWELPHYIFDFCLQLQALFVSINPDCTERIF